MPFERSTWRACPADSAIGEASLVEATDNAPSSTSTLIPCGSFSTEKRVPMSVTWKSPALTMSVRPGLCGMSKYPVPRIETWLPRT